MALKVDALNHFFASKMRFETDHYEIPSEKWQTSLNRKLSDFVFKYDSPDCLILVYYGGHAYFGEETGAFKLSGLVILWFHMD